MQNKQHSTLPQKGLSASSIEEQIKAFQTEDVRWQDGKTWSLVYHTDDAHDELLKNVSRQFFSANYLNPLAFRSLQKMEREVIQMTREMLNGDEDVVGTMSSGGTESILLAMYTYREWAKKHRSHIKFPEIVAPETIHPAHSKAAHLFGMRIRHAKVDVNKMASVEALGKQINQNTILIASSAPSYPHGILDPIADIGRLAEKHKLPFHVDSCIGGFMLPWIGKLDNNLPDWDFRVPGVTSISADVHKFGFGAKGASIILYRSMHYLKHQFFITTDWPGGIYVSPTLLGSRAGGPIASAWASMKHLGEEGYLKIARELMEGRGKLEKLLRAIPEIEIIGQPCMNIISYTTQNNTPDIFAVADHLENQGWMLDRQQSPDCIHLTVMPTNLPVIDQYVEDLKNAIDYVRLHPSSSGSGNAAIYGMSARIPFRGLVKNNVRRIFENMYGAESVAESAVEDGKPKMIGHAPKWMGWVSRILAFWKRISGQR